MGWDGMGWDGMGWDGMGWDGMGWDGMGWDGMGWDGMGWDGTHERMACGMQDRIECKVMSEERCDICHRVEAWCLDVWVFAWMWAEVLALQHDVV